jgi:hypothetical protein
MGTMKEKIKAFMELFAISFFEPAHTTTTFGI